jgi:hypothetical protein
VNEVSPWFERDLAIGTRTAADLAAIEGSRIYKTHLTADWVPRGARSVAVVRDPRDVAVSYYHLYRDYLAFTGDFDAFFARFMSGRLQYGSWFSHVAGWRARAARDPATLIVRYEDIVRDRARAARQLAGFVGLDPSDAVIGRVAELTSFEAMKARESQFDHATALLLERGVRPRTFVRGGRVGDSDTVFSAEKSEAVARAERDARPARVVRLASFLQ